MQTIFRKLPMKTIILLALLIFEIFPQTPYTILISFDGFRWDYTNRNITPAFKFVEENGVSATSLMPVFPSKTFPNHISITTGLHPEDHGIIANDFWSPSCNCEYSFRDTSAVRNADWYKGEMIWETLKKNGIKTASYFWPGSEMNIASRRPDYFHHYDHYRPYEIRVDGILDWLKLPFGERPKFLTLYFDATDTYGHSFGPNSKEVNFAIQKLDSMLQRLFDGLTQIGLRDSTNIIVVSDHGMTEVNSERVIDVEEFLHDSLQYKIIGDGPVIQIHAKGNHKEKIFSLLNELTQHFKIFRRDEVSSYLHFSQDENILDLVLVAELGWSLVHKKSGDWLRKKAKGNHGYENADIDMHGIFFAIGPSFRKGFKIGTISNLEIYPLICSLYNIEPSEKIERTELKLEAILSKNKIGVR